MNKGMSIAPGTYDVYVTPAGNQSVVAIEVQNLALTGGAVLDVLARDAAAHRGRLRQCLSLP